MQWSYGYRSSKLWFDSSYIVLWDGKNTYWCDEMYASSGYKMSLKDMKRRGYVLVGVL